MDTRLAVYLKGMIKDRNGNILAQSGSSETIAARPSQIEDPKGVASLLAPILELDMDELYENWQIKKFLCMGKRQVSREVANEVRYWV